LVAVNRPSKREHLGQLYGHDFTKGSIQRCAAEVHRAPTQPLNLHISFIHDSLLVNPIAAISKTTQHWSPVAQRGREVTLPPARHRLDQPTKKGVQPQ